jgi:hypothetical protein
MLLIWKLLNEAPGPAAIERMRQHFPKPNELMPIPWFMGWDITFHETIAQESPQIVSAKIFSDALQDIAGGIRSFPEVEYVPTWIVWFKYLLPDVILRADAAENFNSSDLWLIVDGIVAFFGIYPDQIIEEYPGFREDVVATLGNRAIPSVLARQAALQQDNYEPLFNDIWDVTGFIDDYGFQSFSEVNSSMLFCLKYLTPTEIVDWATSLFQIDSPQWHLQLILSLSQWFSLLRLARDWNSKDEDFARKILETSGLLNEFNIPRFNSFNEFIPTENVDLFNQTVLSNFSHELFRVWTSEILECLDKSSLSYHKSFAEECRIRHISGNHLKANKRRY